MDADVYQYRALTTANQELTSKHQLLNAALGLSGESGEFADHIKKHLYHGCILDREKVKKELGDIQWYVSLAANALDLNLGEVMQANLDKLGKRWPEGFKPGTVAAGGDTALEASNG